MATTNEWLMKAHNTQLNTRTESTEIFLMNIWQCRIFHSIQSKWNIEKFESGLQPTDLCVCVLVVGCSAKWNIHLISSLKRWHTQWIPSLCSKHGGEHVLGFPLFLHQFCSVSLLLHIYHCDSQAITQKSQQYWNIGLIPLRSRSLYNSLFCVWHVYDSLQLFRVMNFRAVSLEFYFQLHCQDRFQDNKRIIHNADAICEWRMASSCIFVKTMAFGRFFLVQKSLQSHDISFCLSVFCSIDQSTACLGFC